MPSTYDKELALEILKQILEALKKIEKRFRPITSPEKFTNSDVGMEKLDSICMQLIAIGESLKNFKRNLSLTPEANNWEFFLSINDFLIGCRRTTQCPYSPHLSTKNVPLFPESLR